MRSPEIARVRALGIAWVLVLAIACSGSGNRVSQDDRSKSDYHYRLARGYYGDRNIAMTQRELHLALQADPGNWEAWHLRGFMRLGLQDPPGALADFREAVRLKPDCGECRNNMASALIELGRYQEALDALQPVLEDPLYPTPAFAHANAGWAYYQIGNLQEAQRHLTMAIFLAPRMCKAFNNLGIVQRDLGNTAEARDSFEKAVRICPNYGEPWYHLGILRQAAGDGPGAEEAFRRCIEAAPDTPLARRCEARK
ncbi:MAG TPA: tetratricopeptide repeat protein [Myxococcota bacterium]|nr:tetratricopeptide repeat protein [Myxococcota bacterium]